MRGRRRYYTVRASRWLDDHYWGPLLAYASCLVVLLGLACAFYGAAKGVHNSHIHRRQQFGQLIYSVGESAHDNSPRAIELRKRAASRLVELDLRYIQIYGKNSTYLPLSNHRLKQVQQVAKNGRAINVGDLNAWSFSAFLAAMGRWYVLFTIFSGFGLFFLVNFLFQRDDGHHSRYLAELPWNKPWPWVVTLTLGPVGWLGMPCSYLMLDSEEEVGEELPVVEHEEGLYADADDPALDPQVLRSYVSAPASARELYINLSIEALRLIRERRRVRLEEKIDETRDEIQHHADMVRMCNTELNELVSKRRALDEVVDELENFGPEKRAEEFERILSLPGVIAVQVVNSRIRLIVRASISYDDALYDLGDWRMDFGPDTTHIDAYELRSGIRPEWDGSYPAYRLGRGNFCFGNREDEINQHLSKGQYLEAMALATECLNSVNRTDQERIPYAFKEVAVDAEPESRDGNQTDGSDPPAPVAEDDDLRHALPG